MQQYTEKDVQKLVIKYNELLKPIYHITKTWIYYLLDEAYECNTSIRYSYKIQKHKTLSGNVEVFTVA